MTTDEPRIPTRRSRPDRLLVALLCALAGPTAAAAQEPLLLRIRLRPEPGAAAAAHEAVWARSQARARAVIASICTGCLGDWKAPLSPPPPEPAGLVATLAVPAGLETDPGSGASEPSSEPPTTERRP